MADFKAWLSEDPGDYPENPYHNGLKLFLWFVDKYIPELDYFCNF